MTSGFAQLDLLDRRTQEAKARAEVRHLAEIDELIPIAQELGRKAGAHGVTISDVRLTATQRGILPAVGKGRQFAFLGSLMRAAGFVPTLEQRRSVIARSHGNLQRVWILRDLRL